MQDLNSLPIEKKKRYVLVFDFWYMFYVQLQTVTSGLLISQFKW